MKRWLPTIFVVLGFIAFALVVYFGLPFISVGATAPFQSLVVRLAIIGVAFLILVIWALLRWRKRRKGQQELEEALTESQDVGDGAVLAEKIKDAMSVLKKSGSGRTFLYDLPWYVIIGPPGAGKTTALLNSGVEFPMSQTGAASISGIGGTRYCDWWFAEEAVLIDTAGRYTSQDSDAAADKASWESFLQLLKRYRSKQPINGVILAISVEDLMTSDPDTLRGHAETIRARLAEIHETLKIDFPVYVLFTKADLISGFREFFASYSAARRQVVWGTTFRTSTRSEQTFDRVPGEFDALVRRLSQETVHRLSEEPDGINRIAIFGLPAQMAMLKGKISELLRLVFEPTRYSTSAILRGFYFTSGTQEGTPIDQVLGALGTSVGMSGKGKSFFLHDLMKRVIFSEAGWVSYDARAVRRSNLLRIAAFAGMALATVGLIGGWSYSYYQNRQLIASAEAAVEQYGIAAKDELQAKAVSDTDLLKVSPALDVLRDMPAGYAQADASTATMLEGLGLGQRGRVSNAANGVYRDALERLFRPRLVLDVENKLQAAVDKEDGLAVYSALKVYKILGGDPSAIGNYDDVVTAWFEDEWKTAYPGPANRAAREDLMNHLKAMLSLDDTIDVTVPLNPDLISKAEAVAARMPVADRAYALIVATANIIDLPPFNIADAAGRDANRVFETKDGSDLSSLQISPLYTFAGFHEFFLDQLAGVAKKLEKDKWVLGAEAQRAQVDQQISRLGTSLLRTYYQAWFDEWDKVLGNLQLRKMTSDKPDYTALQIASSGTASPILLLTEEIARQTQLTAPFRADPTSTKATFPGVPNGASLLLRMAGRASGLARIGVMVASSAKDQGRAGAAPAQLPGQVIEDEYASYQTMVTGAPGQRPIDALMASLAKMRDELYNTAHDHGDPAKTQAAIGELRSLQSRLPPLLNRLVDSALREFQSDATNASLADLTQHMQDDVVAECKKDTEGRFPFASSPSRQVPITAFADLFAPGGRFDKFFNTYLAQYADTTVTPWVWRSDAALKDSLSPGTLTQFERAAKIRDVFFPGGANFPTVAFSVTLSQVNSGVRRVDFEVNGQSVRMRPADPGPNSMTWGGSLKGGSATITINDSRLIPGKSFGTSGPWALLDLIQKGSPTQVGDVMKLRYTINGRFVGLDLRFDTLQNPFNLPELFQFRCPEGL